MIDPLLQDLLWALAGNLALAFAAWLISLRHNNVGVVDFAWPLFMLMSFGIVAVRHHATDTATIIIGCLASLWALRLLWHLGVRAQGRSEDRRYAEIRQRYGESFPWKSLLLIFGFQGIAASVVSIPLTLSTVHGGPINFFQAVGVAVVLLGIALEALADRQLLQFQRSCPSPSGLLETGVWRYSRHPNYFGEFCVWWGFFIVAMPITGGVSIVSPLLMTYFLLRFTGIKRMEAGINARRPGYMDYARRTSAFFPRLPKN